MNERIRELAVQADNYAYKMNPEQDSYGRSANPRKFQQDRDAKFAELIVEECINICISNRDDDSADHIEKHFGVKE
jgi:hypothetical protein